MSKRRFKDYQISGEITRALDNLGYSQPTAIYGKQPFDKQKAELKQKSHVVVGTPGRVLEHIQKGTFPFMRIN